MKHNGYEESEIVMSFSGESRQGQALRIMEAISGVDEELLERSENERTQSVSDYKKRKYVKSGGYQTFWRYARPWAAVLCLAVVGALGWGGYQLTLKVDNSASGGNMNDMAMQLEAIEFDTDGEGALPEEAGAAEYNAEDMAAQKADDLMRQENGGDFDASADITGTNVTEGYSGSEERGETAGALQHGSGGTEEKSSETAPGMGKEQESASKDAVTDESVMIDSDGCPAMSQKKLTEEEARSQERLGDYIPEEVPRGYSFESAFSNADGQEANLTITWSKGMDSIMWTVVEAAEAPETVDIEAVETYDERLYEIPHAETVPQEYRQSMDNPTFAWEDFTLEAVRSRMISRSDRGDTDTPWGSFAVLFPNNMVVRFNGRGTAEEIWEMFDSIKVTD